MTGIPIKPVLRYPGAKWRIVDWLIQFIPMHEVYVEPFFGSGALFFSKPKSKIEIINDIDNRVTDFFKILRERPNQLMAAIELTPYSRCEYERSYEQTDDQFENARRFLINSWMSYGAKQITRNGWAVTYNGDNLKRGGTSSRSVAWNNLPERIKHATPRLKDAQIENINAIKLIQKKYKKDVFIYADPPYVLSVRNSKQYKVEMDNKGHAELLKVLMAHPGPVLLSGYDCELYNDTLCSSWRKETKNTYAQGAKPRTEILWINNEAYEKRLNQKTFW